jgi:hypothetical protein
VTALTSSVLCRLHIPAFRSVASDREAHEAADELVLASLRQGWLPGPGFKLVGFLKWNLDSSEIGNGAANNGALQRVPLEVPVGGVRNCFWCGRE